MTSDEELNPCSTLLMSCSHLERIQSFWRNTERNHVIWFLANYFLPVGAVQRNSLWCEWVVSPCDASFPSDGCWHVCLFCFRRENIIFVARNDNFDIFFFFPAELRSWSLVMYGTPTHHRPSQQPGPEGTLPGYGAASHTVPHTHILLFSLALGIIMGKVSWLPLINQAIFPHSTGT